MYYEEMENNFPKSVILKAIKSLVESKLTKKEKILCLTSYSEENDRAILKVKSCLERIIWPTITGQSETYSIKDSDSKAASTNNKHVCKHNVKAVKPLPPIRKDKGITSSYNDRDDQIDALILNSYKLTVLNRGDFITAAVAMFNIDKYRILQLLLSL